MNHFPSAAIRMVRVSGIAPEAEEEKSIVETIEGTEGEEVITSDGEMFCVERKYVGIYQYRPPPGDSEGSL